MKLLVQHVLRLIEKIFGAESSTIDVCLGRRWSQPIDTIPLGTDCFSLSTVSKSILMDTALIDSVQFTSTLSVYASSGINACPPNQRNNAVHAKGPKCRPLQKGHITLHPGYPNLARASSSKLAGKKSCISCISSNTSLNKAPSLSATRSLFQSPLVFQTLSIRAE